MPPLKGLLLPLDLLQSAVEIVPGLAQTRHQNASVIVYNDLTATGVLRGLHDAGLRGLAKPTPAPGAAASNNAGASMTSEKEHVIERIAPGIYTSDHRNAEGKNAIVFGSRRVLAIDTGSDLAEGTVMADHSADSTCAYLERERVLFGGDTAVTGIVPAFGDGDSVQLEASLRQLLAMDVDVLVPGHGPVLAGRDRVRDWLGWMVGYLTGVRQYVAREVAQEHLLEAIVQGLPFDEYIQGRLSPERHGMHERHRHTARKMAAELLAQRAT